MFEALCSANAATAPKRRVPNGGRLVPLLLLSVATAASAQLTIRAHPAPPPEASLVIAAPAGAGDLWAFHTHARPLQAYELTNGAWRDLELEGLHPGLSNAYRIAVDPWTPHILWLGRPVESDGGSTPGESSWQLLRFDALTGQLLASEPSGAFNVQQLMPHSGGIYVSGWRPSDRKSLLLSFDAEASLLSATEVPLRYATRFVPFPGGVEPRVLFVADEREDLIAVSPGTGAVERAPQVVREGGDRPHRDWWPFRGGMAFRQGSLFHVVLDSGESTTLLGAGAGLAVQASTDHVWLSRLSWGSHYAPAGIVSVERATAEPRCMLLGNRRAQGARTLEATPNGAWALFGGGLAWLDDADGSLSIVSLPSDTLDQIPPSTSLSLIVDEPSDRLWIVTRGDAGLIELRLSELRSGLVPSEVWHEQERRRAERQEWETVRTQRGFSQPAIGAYLDERLKALEALRYQAELDLTHVREPFKPCYAAHRSAIREEAERFARELIDDVLLERLPQLSAARAQRIVDFLWQNDRRETAPALLSLLDSLPLLDAEGLSQPELDLRRAVVRALVDFERHEEVFARDPGLTALVDRAASLLRTNGTPPPPRYMPASVRELLEQVEHRGGERLLASVLPKAQLVVPELSLQPGLHPSLTRPSVGLRRGDELAVAFRTRDERGSDVLAVSGGAFVWIGSSLRLTDPPLDQAELAATVEQRWASGDLIGALHPTQSLLTTGGPEALDGVGVERNALLLLASVDPVRTAYQVGCTLAKLDLLQLVGDTTRELLVLYDCYYYEAMGVEWSLRSIEGSTTRELLSNATTTTAVGWIEELGLEETRYPAQLDGDADLELVVLRGFPREPETWRIETYDYDGASYVPGPWPHEPATERWLKRHFATGSEVERTVIRGYFGFEGDAVPP